VLVAMPTTMDQRVTAEAMRKAPALDGAVAPNDTSPVLRE
jgi:hypothetical protein